MTVYQRIAEFNKVITKATYVAFDIGGFTLDYLLIRGGRPDLGVCDSQGTGGSFEKVKWAKKMDVHCRNREGQWGAAEGL